MARSSSVCNAGTRKTADHPPWQARRLQALVYEKGYPNEPEEYHSSKCYDGGPLDLRPESRLFP